MDEILYNALSKYYHALELKGYMSISHSYKLLVLIFFYEFLFKDYRGRLKKEDYCFIERALDCIYGTSCLIPYPDYLKMGKLHLGEITEIIERVKSIEDTEVVKLMHNVEADENSDIIVKEEE